LAFFFGINIFRQITPLRSTNQVMIFQGFVIIRMPPKNLIISATSELAIYKLERSLSAMSKRYVVIMAGGRGERFWPESRIARPKQLLPIVGNKAMLAQTVDRLA
jgi:hypothetical protein